jgi:predicted MarR family transcription regulator
MVFRCQPNGFANKDLRALTGELRGLDPDAVTTGQITYDLRRLKHRGLITRIPGTHRYQVTDPGLHTAKFLTTVHDRILPTGLAELAAPEPASSRLKEAATAYRKAFDTLTAATQFAA